MKIIDIKISDVVITCINENYECTSFLVESNNVLDYGLTFTGDYVIFYQEEVDANEGTDKEKVWITVDKTLIIDKSLVNKYFTSDFASVADGAIAPYLTFEDFDGDEFEVDGIKKVFISDIITKMISGD